MNLLLDLSEQTGIRLAEVGFLLILLAGVWLALAHVASRRLSNTRSIVAGVALAVGAALVIVATHWGHFG